MRTLARDCAAILTKGAPDGSGFTMGWTLKARAAWSFTAAALALSAGACMNETQIYRAPGAPQQNLLPPLAHFVAAPPSQCVPYARARSGIEITGDASDWWRLAEEDGYARSFRPAAGSVLVLRVDDEGKRGHVAYVETVVSDREIIVDHANWHGRGEVAVDVPVVDVSPDNDWSQVRVMWLETGQMGARTYGVDGFVAPERHAGP
jgi:hypothetical protein